MSAVRHAEVTWNGDLTAGRGTVTASSSSAFTDLPVSWAARTEAPEGQTSPEELVAAAHAACFAMAFSGALGRAGTPPQRLDVSADVTFDKLDAGWRVVSSALTVRGPCPASRPRSSRLPPRRPRTAARSARRSRAMSSSAWMPPWKRDRADQAIVSSRRGLATVIVSISAALTPAARRRGRKVLAR